MAIFSNDPRRVGTLFLGTSILAAALSLVLTGLLRIEGAGSSLWTTLVTAHGLLLTVFTLLPALCGGFGLWLVPRQVGAKTLAFPRLGFAAWGLHALSLLLAAGATVGNAPQVGLIALSFAGLSAVMVAINIITTFLTRRDPGMTLSQVPVLAWSMAITGGIILMAVPAMAAAGLMMALRPVAPEVMRETLWFFAHPVLFALMVPTFGIVTDIVAAFARRPLAGRPVILLAMGVMAGLGVTLWMQALFSGAAPTGFLTTATAVLALPAALVLTAWCVTLAGGLRSAGSPLLWAAGVFALLTGGAILSVVDDGGARFHYMMGLGAVFGTFGGLYFWLPQMTPRRVPERWACLHALLMFVGVNLSFVPPMFGGSVPLEATGIALSIASFMLFLPILAWSVLRGEERPAQWLEPHEPEALRA